MKSLITYLTLLLTVFFFSVTIAQNDIEFNQLKSKNISTQSITYAIDQDALGNLWIASEEGVLKYNSKNYKIYNTYSGLPSILRNRTNEIFIDSKERIWIGTEKGVAIYNQELDLFKCVFSTLHINPSLVTSILEDKKGQIWVSGFNGLWCIKENNKKYELTRILEVQDIKSIEAIEDYIVFGTSKTLFAYNCTSKNIREISLNKEENEISLVKKTTSHILIGTKSGELFSLDHELKFSTEIIFKKANNHPITNIIQKDDGSLLIATDGDGVYNLTNDFKVLNHWVNDADNIHSLSSNGVYDILLGKEEILWLVTYGGGVNYLDFRRLPFKKICHGYNNEHSIIANFTRSIAKDKNNNYWFGTKKGVSIWNNTKNTWKHITNLMPSTTNIEDIVMALETDEDYMWVGTYNLGLFKVNIHSLERIYYNKKYPDLIQQVYALFKDSQGNIWVGGKGKLAVIDQSDNISHYPMQHIKSIYETKKGDILASGGFGVYKINHETKDFQSIKVLNTRENKFSYTAVNNLVENHNGDLILATSGGGVIFFNPKTNKIDALKINNGMPSDIVQSVLVSRDSSVWASTTRGLVKVKILEKDTLINTFDQNDGLASLEFNYGSYRKFNDTLFAFGGTDGVTFFNPLEIKEEIASPVIVFDEFKLFNKVVKPGQDPLTKHINQTKEIELDYNENSIELVYTGILHTSSSKIKYSYHLMGFDKTWSKPSEINQATYTNLPPGDYTFKVKAYNKLGDESKIKEVKFHILSPWWATNVAFVIYFLIALSITLIAIHFTSVIVKKKNADEQIDFFNNITHEIKTPLTILISSLDKVTHNDDTGEESKKRIKTTVKRINSLFEQMLNFQKFTSEQKLSLDVVKIDLQDYITQKANNFKPLTQERDLKIIINNEYLQPEFYFDRYILDKILLNLISNAIKYSKKSGQIYLNLLNGTNGELKIEVIDEGIGIPKDQQKFILKRYYRARNVINSQRPGTGLGLMMVKKLLEKTGGSIAFYSEENRGAKFTTVLKNLKDQYRIIAETQEKELALSNQSFDNHDELSDYSNSKILIVEDNNVLRNVLVENLGVYFQIFEAKNGKEGIEKANQVFPDIILTDLIMPEIDGIQMAKILKDDINLNHIPIFMLTVLQNSEQKLESVESGISEYIEKPVDIKFLLAKVINTLKWQQKLRDKYVYQSDVDNAKLFRNKNDQDFLSKLEGNVLDNIENKSFSVHDLSASFGMSRTSLYMKLKNLVDLSPQDFIIHTKLNYAKSLLIKGVLTIKAVAYSSGFSNPKYFSTSFKKFYKMTPSKFLESLREDN